MSIRTVQFLLKSDDVLDPLKCYSSNILTVYVQRSNGSIDFDKLRRNRMYLEVGLFVAEKLCKYLDSMKKYREDSIEVQQRFDRIFE